ncbi:MAG: glutamate-1-semialdehyde 2,1-aminomutase [Herpetosiphonaceae bacterium]|nr:glutamate-1-semialdehyde 2,1-aminomutase [Herpetosiphonaceae bacterium]
MTESERLFAAAQRVLPGGVNSPVRAFRGVGGTPRFIDRAEGAYLFDADGQRYIDYVLSWGPMILGHAEPSVIAAITAQAQRGTSYGAPTALETELAELVIQLVPSIEMLRFVNSGTEATMSALRLARAATGRSRIVKFSGGYHGHADFLLTDAGSGVATLGLPASAGVTAGQTSDTVTVGYNDLPAVQAVFEQHGATIAAIIVEPVAGNMGLVLPQPGFLAGLRALTQQYGAVLIFDEVMTGFRVALGGAQEHYGITPDLTCLGKVVGGGLPCAAYGGRRDLMEHVAPLGAMYQAGTLSGNPLAMAAGLATLRQLTPQLYTDIAGQGQRLLEGLREAATQADIPLQTAQAGTMFGFFFADEPITNYALAKAHANTGRYARFFHAILEQGVYFAPSQFEAGFLSRAHTAAVIDATIAAATIALGKAR